jgi:AraC-like DNA-binding protein
MVHEISQFYKFLIVFYCSVEIVVSIPPKSGPLFLSTEQYSIRTIYGSVLLFRQNSCKFRQTCGGNKMSVYIHGHTWKIAQQLQGLRISTACEHYTLSPGLSHNYKMPMWSMLYIYEGGCMHTPSTGYNAYPYHQTPSQALLCPPNVDRYERRIGRNKSHAAFILFHESKDSLLKRLHKSLYGWTVFEDDNKKTLGSLMNECAAIGYKNGDTGFWKAQEVLCRIIGLLLASYPVTNGHYNIAISGDNTNEPLSRRVDACLHAKIDQAITLKDISEELGFSVSTLTHKYQKETGISPMAVLARKKVDRIKMFLKMGYPVKAIAQQMSFPDSSGLSKFFKQNQGISPREFLQQSKSLKGRLKIE